MTGGEFLFSFFSLLLGLAIANIATATGELWRSKHRIALGWLIPLLGLVVLLSASQQWLSFWEARAGVRMTPWFLLGAIGVAFPYIFISASLLPHAAEGEASLDAYYLRNNRAWLIALLVPVLVNLTVYLNLHAHISFALPIYAVRLAIPLTMLAWQRPAVHRVGLTLLALTMVVRIFASSWT